MSHFNLTDRFAVPAQLSANHSTLPQQSIFVLNNACSEEHKLIRLFLGTVEIEHKQTGRRWKQSSNYSVFGCPRTGIRTYKGIDNLLQPYDLSQELVDKHLRLSLRQRKYYGELLEEICQSLWRTKKGEHTIAFLHIYRFLEHISFAFPLLYASRTADFGGAFSSLKEFFTGGSSGELGFFRKFIQASIDPASLGRGVKIDFRNINPVYKSNIYSVIKRQIQPDQIISAVEDVEIEIKNEAIIDLFISLRNRYFHYNATNQANISVNEIGDSDELFLCINQVAMNWLAILYFETLKHRVQAVI